MIEQEPLDDQYPPASSAASQLFTVRVWVESAQGGSRQVRVEVKHVLSGASRTFREWSQVVAFIEDRLQDGETPPTTKDDQR